MRLDQPAERSTGRVFMALGNSGNYITCRSCKPCKCHYGNMNSFFTATEASLRIPSSIDYTHKQHFYNAKDVTNAPQSTNITIMYGGLSLQLVVIGFAILVVTDAVLGVSDHITSF